MLLGIIAVCYISFYLSKKYCLPFYLPRSIYYLYELFVLIALKYKAPSENHKSAENYLVSEVICVFYKRIDLIT